jgi:hypothetical protein
MANEITDRTPLSELQARVKVRSSTFLTRAQLARSIAQSLRAEGREVSDDEVLEMIWRRKL